MPDDKHERIEIPLRSEGNTATQRSSGMLAATACRRALAATGDVDVSCLSLCIKDSRSVVW